MDLFGIGNAMKAAVEICFVSCRGTGRTTHMLKSLKDGDRIVFATLREKERVVRLCREQGLQVECLFYNPDRSPDEILSRKPPRL